MKRACEGCKATYDDAVSTTICPHDRFLSDEQAAQKDLAFSLVNKEVSFAHQPEGPFYRVQSIGWDGMVTLAGMHGEFAPHIFKVKES